MSGSVASDAPERSHPRATAPPPNLRIVRPRRAAPSEAARVTRAEINLAHVRHNLHEVRTCMAADATAAGRPPAEVWPVLKADGYGHGAAALGTTLERAGVDGICVALLEEAIELRQAGVAVPILVMGGYYGRYRDGLEALVEHDLSPVVYDPEQLDRLGAAARYLQRGRAGGAATSPRLDVHLMVDTGMGRLGVRPDDEGLEALLDALHRHPELRLDALMTHFACADEPDEAPTRAQLARFDEVTARVRMAGFRPRRRHAANSAACLRFPEAQMSFVRPGIAIVGVHPCPEAPRHTLRVANLRPAMRVVSEVVALRQIPAGASIGYGHRWTAARPSRIATLPMGYADGLDRALSHRGHVLIDGQRAPIVGSVSMDLTMVDVTDIDGVALRDEVVVLGRQRGRRHDDAITAEDIARQVGSIPWECLTGISRRVPRYYRHP
ncbi:MAG: alanine racemase [Myxococcota bacterium]